MLAQIFSEAFSDEVSHGMQQITAKQFIELSKKLGVKIFVTESKESKAIAFFIND